MALRRRHVPRISARRSKILVSLPRRHPLGIPTQHEPLRNCASCNVTDVRRFCVNSDRSFALWFRVRMTINVNPLRLLAALSACNGVGRACWRERRSDYRQGVRCWRVFQPQMFDIMGWRISKSLRTLGVLLGEGIVPLGSRTFPWNEHIPACGEPARITTPR